MRYAGVAYSDAANDASLAAWLAAVHWIVLFVFLPLKSHVPVYNSFYFHLHFFATDEEFHARNVLLLLLLLRDG